VILLLLLAFNEDKKNDLTLDSRHVAPGYSMVTCGLPQLRAPDILN